MGMLGNLILISSTAGVTYYATTSMKLGGAGGPVALSPEIQKYIDTKLTQSQTSTTQDLQKVGSRLSEMETKLIDIERLRSTYDQLANKSAAIESAIADQRRRRDELISQARSVEMVKLRNEIATVCAGVTVKRVESATEKGASPEAAKFQQNIGAGGSSPRPAARPAPPRGGAPGGVPGGQRQ